MFPRTPKDLLPLDPKTLEKWRVSEFQALRICGWFLTPQNEGSKRRNSHWYKTPHHFLDRSKIHRAKQIRRQKAGRIRLRSQPGGLFLGSNRNFHRRWTGWWQLKYFLFWTWTLGKWSILTNIFQRGWNHKLVKEIVSPFFSDALKC